MLNSSYDGEIEQWDMIDKYSMNVIYTASVDIRRRMSAKKRSFDFIEFGYRFSRRTRYISK